MIRHTSHTCPIWDYDDFTQCIQRDYLELKYPLFLLALSLCSIVYQVIKPSKPHITLESFNIGLKEDHFSFFNIPTIAKRIPKLVGRNSYDRAVNTLELFVLISEFLLIARIKLIASLFSYFDFYVRLGLWLFLLGLYILRNLQFLADTFTSPVNYWGHSAWLYLMIWFSSLIRARSSIIHPISQQITNVLLLEFSFVSILLFIVSTIGIGNAPVTLYYEDGIDPAPEPVAGIISQIYFSWVDPLIWKASSKPLEESDIWGLNYEDFSIGNIKSFEQSKINSKFSIKIFRYFTWEFAAQLSMSLSRALIVFIPTVLLNKILEYIEDPSKYPRNVVWVFILLMPIVKAIDSILGAQTFYMGRKIAMRMRSILIGEIYSKALRKNMFNTPKEDNSQSPADLGKIMNLMSGDVNKVVLSASSLHHLSSSLCMLIISIILLFNFLGVSSLAGMMGLLITIPVNTWLVGFALGIEKKTSGFGDQRIQKTNEALQNIRTIKYFNWEERFLGSISDIRDQEITNLRKSKIAWIISGITWYITPTFITFASFYFYSVVFGHQLTASVGFTSLALFNLLRAPLDAVSNLMSTFVSIKVASKRIEVFMDEPETKKYEQLVDRCYSPSTYGFKDTIISWGIDDFQLGPLNLVFIPQKLNLIIGPTGSGKTSLLLALLGEMYLIRGDIRNPAVLPRDELQPDPNTGLTNSVAYCSQTAWLLNDTIKNNILFSSQFEPSRYDSVLKACCLVDDIRILKDGDASLIGERGITLSGGQKQRISLARAIYSNSNLVLLDDCLSAVDAHTAEYIYHYGIVGPLMKERTCVLVSHNLELALRKAEFVVQMENGIVKQQGKPKDMSNITSDPELLVNLEGSRNYSVPSEPEDVGKVPITIENDLLNAKQGEKRAIGHVGYNVYSTYASMLGGWSLWSLVIISFLGAQVLNMSQAFWLRKWTSEAETEESNAHSASYYSLIYALVGVLYSVATCIRMVFTFNMGINASNRTFIQALTSIMRARLRFLDTTPIGRIINRFSNDLNEIDSRLIPFADSTVAMFIECVCTIGLIGYVVPQFLFFSVFIGVAYVFVGSLYNNASRELKRFEAVTRSPIYQQFNETLVGASTIRAFGEERRFMKENLTLIDKNNRVMYHYWLTGRWLNLRVELIASFVIFFASTFMMLNISSIDAGLAGLTLSFAISFNENALWLVQNTTLVETMMNAVERLQEYFYIEQEPAAIIPGREPREGWPEKGCIDFHDVSLRYSSELPRIIHDVSFHIEGGKRVAIVGRTGAGKSTIMTALFRFLDPEAGCIKIDGVDISKIGLDSLRKSITIIPQDPSLFKGSLKSNLDPFSEYSDKYLFRALKRVNLIDESHDVRIRKNANKFADLETVIEEGGMNISQGQRQLVCLARALLKRANILLLDEATASIDYESDSVIQETLRKEFSDSTVITIAHRLKTIIDYDKVLVMDKGRVVEYDNPQVLLKNESSTFYGMCEKSGKLK